LCVSSAPGALQRRRPCVRPTAAAALPKKTRQIALLSPAEAQTEQESTLGQKVIFVHNHLSQIHDFGIKCNGGHSIAPKTTSANAASVKREKSQTPKFV